MSDNGRVVCGLQKIPRLIDLDLHRNAIEDRACTNLVYMLKVRRVAPAVLCLAAAAMVLARCGPCLTVPLALLQHHRLLRHINLTGVVIGADVKAALLNAVRCRARCGSSTAARPPRHLTVCPVCGSRTQLGERRAERIAEAQAQGDGASTDTLTCVASRAALAACGHRVCA